MGLWEWKPWRAARMRQAIAKGVLPQEGDKEESNVVVTKGRDFWIESKGKIAHTSMAALAIVA
jgi:hypothetical protein